jgi:hypothetical protein
VPTSQLLGLQPPPNVAPDWNCRAHSGTAGAGGGGPKCTKRRTCLMAFLKIFPTKAPAPARHARDLRLT